MYKNSVILLTYNKWKLAQQRVYELSLYLPETIEVVIVLNGCSDETKDKIAPYLSKNMKLFHLKENKGFSGGHNVGAKIASGNNLYFLSNDVIIESDFVTPIENKLDNKTIIAGRIINWSAGWNEIFGYVFPYPEGWFVAMNRNIYNLLDGWDERFYPSDCEDLDMGIKACTHEIHLVQYPYAHHLHHIGGMTQNSPTRMDMTKINHAKLVEKWQGSYGRQG